MKFPGNPVALVLLAIVGQATGAVVYSGVQNILIPTNFDGVYLDIIPAAPTTPSGPTGGVDAGGGSFTISHSEPANWDVNFFFGGLGIAHTADFNPYRADETDIFSPIHNLGLNTYIDGTPTGVSEPLLTPSFGGSGDASGSPSTNHVGSANSQQFNSGVEGYMAFVLEDSGTTYYGWMRVTLTDDGTPGTIHDWAYDTNPINIGAVPEPRMFALLLAGGLLAFRRKR